MEMDFPAIANCFAYTLLQRLLSHTEEAQENLLKLGKIMLYIKKKIKKKHKIFAIYRHVKEKFSQHYMLSCEK